MATRATTAVAERRSVIFGTLCSGHNACRTRPLDAQNPMTRTLRLTLPVLCACLATACATPATRDATATAGDPPAVVWRDQDRVRDQYRQDGSWQRYTQGFLQHLSSQQEAVAQLADLVTSSNYALLSFEADPSFCHRSMVADTVKAECGAEVRHLRPLAAKKVTAEPRQRLAV